MLRTAQSLPPTVAFDAGLRPRPYPDEAASLLPGLLAATRTGLTPAGDDELTTKDQLHTTTSSLLSARMIKAREAIARTGLTEGDGWESRSEYDQAAVFDICIAPQSNSYV
jgi:hypothetical protein